MARKHFYSMEKMRALANRRGIDNPFALSKACDINYKTAKRWWYDRAERLDADTLIAVSEALNIEPRELVEIVEKV